MFYSLEYNVKDTTYTLFFTIFLGPPLSRKFTAFHGQTLVYRVAFTQVHGGFTGDFFDFFFTMFTDPSRGEFMLFKKMLTCLSPPISPAVSIVFSC